MVGPSQMGLGLPSLGGLLLPLEGSEAGAELVKSCLLPGHHPLVEEVTDRVQLISAEVTIGTEVEGEVIKLHQDPALPLTATT